MNANQHLTVNNFTRFISDKIKDIDTTMERAEAKGIQVVPVDILDEFEADPTNAVFLITKKNIAPWGTDVQRYTHWKILISSSTLLYIVIPQIDKRLGLNNVPTKSGSKSGSKASSGKESSSGRESFLFYSLVALTGEVTDTLWNIWSLYSKSHLSPTSNELSDDCEWVQACLHRQIRSQQSRSTIIITILWFSKSYWWLNFVFIADKSGGDKLKLKLKGGGVVDPDSGLADEAHVYKSKESLYSVVLGVVDIQKDRNSYYKLQVLEHDKKKK